MTNHQEFETGKEKEFFPDVESFLKYLQELNVKEAEKKPEDKIEGAFKEIPKVVQERLQEKMNEERKMLIELGLSEDKVDQFIAVRSLKEVQNFREGYEDKRFLVGEGERMPKDEYAKMEILDEIEKILKSGKPINEEFKKIARLSFDANGLKAANDLSGSHDKGTEFLKRIAEVFHNEEGPTRKWLKEQGISKLLATTGGGDEYGVLLFSEKPLDPSIVNEAVRRFESEIAALDASDLVDFNDPEVLLRYEGIPKEVFLRLPKEEQETKLREIKSQVPEGFKFLATASGGGVIGSQGLEYALKAALPPDQRLKPDDPYQRVLEKIMGGLWSASDKKAEESKTNFKESLRKSTDARDLFYSKVLARSKEARELEKKLEDLGKENADLKRFLKEVPTFVYALAKAGVTPEKLVTSVEEEIKKRIIEK